VANGASQEPGFRHAGHGERGACQVHEQRQQYKQRDALPALPGMSPSHHQASYHGRVAIG
jgi:hypothetical protein